MILHHLADVLRERGNLKEARTLAEEACTLYERHSDWPAAERQHAARVLGATLIYLEDFAALDAFDRKQVADLRARPKAEDPELATALARAAHHLLVQKKYVEAEALHREALALRRKLFGDEHPEVARSLAEVAFVLRIQKELQEAEAVSRETLAMRRKILGFDHGDTGYSLNQLMVVLRDQGKLAEAEAVLREELVRVRALDTNAPARDNPRLGWTLYRLAELLRERKALAEARVLATEAVARCDPALRERAVEVLTAVLTDLRDLAGIEALLRQRVEELRARPVPDDPQLASALVGLTRNLLRQKKFAEAEPLARECLTIRERQLPDDWQTFNARSLVGRSLLGQTNYAEAEPLLLSGYEGMKLRADSIPDGSKGNVNAALKYLIQLYQGTGQSEKAAEWEKHLAELENADAQTKIAAPKP